MKKLNGTQVEINGWVKNIRKHKKTTFLDINDGSCETDIQIVVDNQILKNIHAIQQGKALNIYGTIQQSERSTKFKEINATYIKTYSNLNTDILNESENLLTSAKNSILEKCRSESFRDVLKIRSQLYHAFNHCFSNLFNFMYITLPTITFTDCEGGGEMFCLENSKDYFGNDAYLSISGQLYLEVASVSMGRVYSISQAFRAEKFNTTRHLSEFTMIEAEIPFLDCVQNLMSLTEKILKSTFHFLNLNDSIVKDFLDQEYPKISYSEAIKILNQSPEKDIRCDWGDPLCGRHEKYLASEVFNYPIFIYDYPSACKPFYMKAYGGSEISKDDRSHVTASFDLIFPDIGEVAGGGIRENNYDQLLKSLRRLNLDETKYLWYLDSRREESIPHGGFGIGFDRILQHICGIQNIKNVSLAPRIPGFSYY